MTQQPDNPATRFTMHCLRSRFDPASLDAARALAAGLDWDAWVEAARAEFLTPLLFHVVHGREIVPAAVEARLHTDYVRNVRANVLRFRELGRVLRTLADRGAQTILLKGAALAEKVYGNIGLRPMADLDLLVRREDLASTLAALEKLGYQVVGAEAQAGDAIAFENEVMLLKPGPPAMLIEVHWSLLDSPHYQRLLQMAWFWDTAVPACVEGTQARALGTEALLLHLCAHLALHHRGEGLLWQHDVAEVLHFFQNQLDWELLLAKAAAYDLVLPLQQVLLEVVDQWSAPAPPAVLERLRKLQPSAGEARVFTWLTASERPVAQRFWADLVSMPSWSQRLRYGAGNLFPAAAYMRQRYDIRHGFLLPLYYPYRWLIGLWGAMRLARKTDKDSAS